MRVFGLVAAAFFLSACPKERSIDPTKCQLEIETRLDWAFTHERWRLEKNTFVALVFDMRSGDGDLLDKYLQGKGYSQAAHDPKDQSTRHLGYYFPNSDPQFGQPVADQKLASFTACQASNLTGANLKSVIVMSSGQPVFEAKLNQ